METMRCFVLKVRPTAAAVVAHDMAGANAIVWVRDSDPERAETAARAYVMAQGWIVEAVARALAPTPEQIADLDEVMSAGHLHAERDGIHALFVGWPKAPRLEDAPVELRSLPEPSDDREH